MIFLLLFTFTFSKSSYLVKPLIPREFHHSYCGDLNCITGPILIVDRMFQNYGFVYNHVFQELSLNDTIMNFHCFERTIISKFYDEEREYVYNSIKKLGLKNIREIAFRLYSNVFISIYYYDLDHEDHIILSFEVTPNNVTYIFLSLVEDGVIEILGDTTIKGNMKITKVLGQFLNKLNISKDEIKHVVLYGSNEECKTVEGEISSLFGKRLNLLSEGDSYEDIIFKGLVKMAKSLQNTCTEDVILIVIVQVSLGIKVYSDQMYKVIPECVKIPTYRVESFTTYLENQTEATIEVYNGYNENINDNVFLGKLHLSNLTNGFPVIEVEFLIDPNGIFKVTAATEKNNSVSLVIDPSIEYERDLVWELRERRKKEIVKLSRNTCLNF